MYDRFCQSARSSELEDVQEPSQKILRMHHLNFAGLLGSVDCGGKFERHS